MAKETKTFSIADKICELTKKPFGTKYEGVFSIRRPSFQDKIDIAVRHAAGLSFAGNISVGTMNETYASIAYIFVFIQTLTETPLPEWFDTSKLFGDIDEAAISAVWQEAEKFINSFRLEAVGTDSKQAGVKP